MGPKLLFNILPAFARVWIRRSLIWGGVGGEEKDFSLKDYCPHEHKQCIVSALQIQPQFMLTEW